MWTSPFQLWTTLQHVCTGWGYIGGEHRAGRDVRGADLHYRDTQGVEQKTLEHNDIRDDAFTPPRTTVVSESRAARRRQDREIARLAIPAFAALVSEPAFLLADAAIVGHLGTPSLAALAIAGSVVQAVIGMFVFLAYGTTSTVARNLGAGSTRAALSSGIDGIWLAVVVGMVAGLATIALSEPVIGLFSPADDVASLALTYLRIAAFGIPPLLLTFAATGVLRGLQDVRTPLVVAVAANVVNIGLNLWFVYGLDWGLAGSAAGTLVAQGAGAAALVAVVVRGASRHHVSLVPHRAGVLASWRTGLPLILRTVTLRATLLLATYVAAGISTVAVAAHQVALTIWTFLAFALDAIAIAGQAITGRLLGAGDAAAARQAARRMMWWGIVAGAVLGAAVIVSRPAVVPLFSPDADVQALLATVLVLVALQQPIAGVVFVLDGVLIGAGDGRYLAWAGVVNFVVFAPLALAVLWTDSGLIALWFAFIAFMTARMGTLLWRERGDHWVVLGAAPGPRGFPGDGTPPTEGASHPTG